MWTGEEAHGLHVRSKVKLTSDVHEYRLAVPSAEAVTTPNSICRFSRASRLAASFRSEMNWALKTGLV